MAIFNKKNNESKGSSSELDDVFFDNRKNKKEKEKEVPHEID